MKTLEFKNVPADIQEKIIKQEINDMYEFGSQYDPDIMLEGFALKLNLIGFNTTQSDISYSGFCSQGDGLSFVGELDIGVFCTKILAEHTKEQDFDDNVIAMLEKYKNDIGVFKVVRKYSNYVHEKSVEFDFEDFDDVEFMSFLESFRYELCILMYTELKDYHDDFLTPANVRTRLEEINMYWTLESPFESFEIKPKPTYDYEFEINYDAVNRLNLSIIDINRIALAETTIINMQNTLDCIPVSLENKLLFLEGYKVIRDEIYVLRGLYQDQLITREYPGCCCKDNESLIHNVECVYHDLYDDHIKYVTVASELFDVIYTSNVIDIIYGEKLNYDFEDNVDEFNKTQVVFLVYNLSEYFEALAVVEKIKKGVDVKTHIDMTATVYRDDAAGCVL